MVGSSLGAASAFVAAAGGASIDGIVSVSCPAAPPFKLPVGDLADRWYWRWLMRVMGTRLEGPARLGPWPIDAAARLSGVPVMVVHASHDFLVSEDSSRRLYEELAGPKTYLVVDAGHAQLPDSEPVRSWLKGVLPQ